MNSGLRKLAMMSLAFAAMSDIPYSMRSKNESFLLNSAGKPSRHEKGQKEAKKYDKNGELIKRSASGKRKSKRRKR